MALLIRLSATLVAFLLLSATGVSGAAPNGASAPSNHPETVYAWAWMTVRNPSTGTNLVKTPNAQDTGQRVTFFGTGTYKHLAGAGRYKVTYPGLVPDLGPGQPIALVTPMGNTRRMCTVRNVTDVAADYVVTIRCYNGNGTPTDTPFSTSLLLAEGTPTFGSTKGAAYVRADDPTNGSYTPSVQYNSTHGSGVGPFNTVDRIGTGDYKVNLLDLGASGGNVQVSVYGTLAGYCRVVSWGVGSPTSDTDASVRCFAPNGSPTDLKFTLLYTRKVGLNLKGTGNKAYVFSYMPNPSPNPYTPAGSISWKAYSGTTQIAKLATGRYRVYLNGITANSGAALVTPSLGGTSTCILGSIRTSGSPQTLEVRCYKTSGAPVNGTFTVSYMR